MYHNKRGNYLKSLTKIFVVAVMILLVGFTIIQNESKGNISAGSDENSATVNEDEQIANKSLLKFNDLGMMTVSWYGPRFHGRLTANGETFDQTAFTAAHKSMRFGTLLRLTNPKNKKSVIVRINDRGPYIPGRNLDLSRAAAEKLGVSNKGVSKLKVEKIIFSDLDMPVVALN